MRYLIVFFLVSITMYGQHANVTISTAATSNGTWTLVGAVNIFTPTADNANVFVDDLVLSNRKFANDRSVEIKTACTTCTQVGDITVNTPVYSFATSTVDRSFQLTAGNDIMVVQPVNLGYGLSSTNKGIGINFTSGGNIYANESITSTGNGGFSGQPQASPAISLVANETFYLASGRTIDAGGTTGSNSYGGSAGKITISGLGGVSLLGTMNALGGTSNLSTFYYGPSNDIEITTNYSQVTVGGINDGVAGGTLNGANIIKAGTGVLSLSGNYNWTASSMDNRSIYLKINNGTVQLNNSVTLYQLQMNSANAILESGNFSQTIYQLNGQGIIRNHMTGNAYLYLGNRLASNDVFNGQIQNGNGIVHVISRSDTYGSLKLTGLNTYTGNTEIFSGTLLLGASNVIPDTGHLKFTGGVLKSMGYNEVFGPVDLTSNSQLIVGSGVHQLTFGSVGTFQSGRNLEIRGWQGDANGQVLHLTKHGMLNSSSTAFVNTNGVLQSSPGINRFGQIGSGGISALGGKIVINSRLSSIQLAQLFFVKASDLTNHPAIQLGTNEVGSDFTQ